STLMKETVSNILRSFKRAKQIRTPIFIIFFNRKYHLEKSLKSYEQLGDIDIVIHDNGSDDPETVEYLKKLENKGVTIYRYPKIEKRSELNNINDSINKYFKNKR